MSTKPARSVQTAKSKTQNWDDGVVETDRVLRDLRARARKAFDLPEVADDHDLCGMEVFAIFVISYVSHYSAIAPVSTRSNRALADHQDFVDPKRQDGLPYYVMHTHHVGGPSSSSVPERFAIYYASIVAHTAFGVADYEFDDTAAREATSMLKDWMKALDTGTRRGGNEVRKKRAAGQ